MTYKIDISACDTEATFTFHGLLDTSAVVALKSLCVRYGRNNFRSRIVLKTGTRVERGLIEELAKIENVLVEAESPFLASLIQSGETEKGE